MDESPPPPPRQSIDLLAHIQGLLEERELRNREQLDRIIDQISSVDRITDAKFVTFRTLIDSQAEKVALALAAADKAVTKAEAATEKRFEGVNEFRAALNDQTRLQVTTDKFDSVVDGLNGRIRSLEARIEKAEGSRSGGRDVWGYLVAAAGIVIAVIAFYAR